LQFFNPRLQKNQLGALSQGNSNHRLLWWDSYKDVDHALAPDESILHKIIIIIIIIGKREGLVSILASKPFKCWICYRNWFFAIKHESIIYSIFYKMKAKIRIQIQNTNDEIRNMKITVIEQTLINFIILSYGSYSASLFLILH